MKSSNIFAHKIILEIFDSNAVKKLKDKFAYIDSTVLDTAIKELLRYLYLVANSQKEIFFPGNQLIDDLWHALIVETESYRQICHQMKPNSFIEHSGLTYYEYCKRLSPEALHNEQLSWLASYVNAFGSIKDESFKQLPIAISMARRMKLSLSGLNELANKFVDVEKITNRSNFQSLDDIIDRLITSNASQIASSPVLSASVLEAIVDFQSSSGTKQFTLSNHELQNLFGRSTSLAFTLWQYIAATERLSRAPDWQIQNQEVWENIRCGKLLCGLATTHLAKVDSPLLVGVESETGFIVNGVAPWASGYLIFDKIVVGFICGDDTVFVLLDFNSSVEKGFIPQRISLEALNGTSSVRIEFKDFIALKHTVISRRNKNNSPIRAFSPILMPDLGIGRYALEIAEEVLMSKNKMTNFEYELVCLKKQFTELEVMRDKCLREGIDLDPIHFFKKDEFNRNTVRFLTFCMGATALEQNSIACRLQKELILLDVVFQSQEVFSLKKQSILTG